jgi:PHP family Zn ribbon phosphoesterase
VETDKLNGRCPSCGGLITVGVDHRVHELAKHKPGYKPKHAGKVIYSVPLQEIIADALGKGKLSKGIQEIYFKMTDSIGTEFAILHEVKRFPDWVPARVVLGIFKVREGDVHITPGYDGIYGVVKVLEPEDPRIALWGFK